MEIKSVSLAQVELKIVTNINSANPKDFNVLSVEQDFICRITCVKEYLRIFQ